MSETGGGDSPDGPSSRLGPLSEVVPPRPDEPGIPFGPIAEDAYDAELEALAATRARPGARVAFIARLVAIAASAALAFALRHDLRYAFASRTPVEIALTPSAIDAPGAPTATTAQLAGASHHLVVVHGIPGGVGAVDYRRPIGEGVYRLAPLVDRPDVYVEMRLPDGIDPTRFVPPTTIRGRLAPLDEAGARFSHAREMIESATGRPVPAQAYILEQGSEPSWGSPGAMVALVAILLCAGQIAIVVAPKRKPAA